uniref:Large ribosomal subunit protein bL35c n=1 Tax=Lophocladia kuetzingii TaxID=675577 RepID=A0A1Z1MNZ8_9FLOR|nr:ribosomal protein L35 [Lophocladia kuetzingii]ARW67656.1 ribosomal protein L35 [Lophocladia kuetzingii]
MYKLKTNRSINKRFKITSKGKLLRRKSYRSHLLQKKSSKRKRQLRKVSIVSLGDYFNLVKGLPYIHEKN